MVAGTGGGVELCTFENYLKLSSIGPCWTLVSDPCFENLGRPCDCEKSHEKQPRELIVERAMQKISIWEYSDHPGFLDKIWTPAIHLSIQTLCWNREGLTVLDKIWICKYASPERRQWKVIMLSCGRHQLTCNSYSCHVPQRISHSFYQRRCRACILWYSKMTGQHFRT
jgi:hypothetical protein